MAACRIARSRLPYPGDDELPPLDVGTVGHGLFVGEPGHRLVRAQHVLEGTACEVGSSPERSSSASCCT